MKKNAFLTFIFACIPGAGQMYYGYMKRGTSLLVYFYLVAGDPKPDGFLLPPDWQNQIGGAKTKMTPKMNKIIGWCLLLTGAYVMYDRVIWPIVESIFVQLGIHWSMIYAINDVIPSIVVAVLLIAFGGRLLGFGKHAHHNDTDDLPPYQG